MIDWIPMIQQCAPQVHLSTMYAIIRTESGFNPLAININGGTKLRRQPRSKAEAIGWSRWLITRGYSVDLGLMQINSANLLRLGLDAETVFDPCRNLQAGASILADNYGRASLQSENTHSALLKAISAYNTGNFKSGFRNGYVARVTEVPVVLPSDGKNVPPLFVSHMSRQKVEKKRLKRGKNTVQRTVSHKEPSQVHNASLVAGTAAEGW